MLREIKKDTEQMIEVLVLAISEFQSEKGIYCRLHVSDGDLKIPLFVWDQKEEFLPFKKGDVILGLIRATEYRGNLSYTLKSYEKSQTSPWNFVKKTPIPSEQMYAAILKTSQKYCPILYPIVQYLFEQNKNILLYQPASSFVHHGYCGGLLYHIYRMLQSAISLQRIYHLDMELMVAGTVLHDIGKIKELNASFLSDTEFTIEGNLCGHIILGNDMILEAAMRFPTIPKERVQLLKHIILAHHGKKEWGSNVNPCIPEAMVIHFLDCIDSKMDIFNEKLEKLNNGELSKKDYFLGTALYKPL